MTEPRLFSVDSAKISMSCRQHTVNGIGIDARWPGMEARQLRRVPSQCTYNLRRIARDDRAGRHVAADHGPGPDDASRSDGDAFQDQAVHPDEDVVLDHDRRSFAAVEVALPLVGPERMKVRIDHRRVGADLDPVPDLNPVGCHERRPRKPAAVANFDPCPGASGGEYHRVMWYEWVAARPGA